MSSPPVARSRPGRRSAVVGLARSIRDVVLGGGQVLAVLVAAPLLRRRYNRAGADDAEVAGPMPGDDLVPDPWLGYTRAISIAAPVEQVWPWLVQIGQGRGGLYSYDGLENLIGCRIHSAEEIRPELQELRPGDLIRLAPSEQSPSFRVDRVEPPTTLVLVSAGPPGTTAGGPQPDDGTTVTWQWVLRPVAGGRRTRLIVRQRLRCAPSQRLLWRVIEPVGFVMERRMLRGLARRAEQTAARPRNRRHVDAHPM
jgi:hypothetical protein